MARLFGTDGVRGVANTELTAELALALGRAAARVLAGRWGDPPRVVVGRDTRASGEMLEAALAAGLMSAGATVIPLGVMTTPGVSYLTGALHATGGAVISASHNPPEYNGIKFFDPQGRKLPDELEEAVEELVLDGRGEGSPAAGGGPGAASGSGTGDGAAVAAGRGGGAPAGAAGFVPPVGGGVGRWQAVPDAGERYLEHLRRVAGPGLEGLRVVLDCAHGAATPWAPAAWRAVGARVTVIHDAPDGTNINVGCGSTAPQSLAEAVRREGADLGLAFDGDADRVIAVDEQGRVVDGDAILAVLALDMARRGDLPGGTVVATVMSNLGLERALKAAGLRLVRTRVGDRHVCEAMEEGGYVLGGEQSGHIILRRHAVTGDGILTGLALASVMVRTGQPLSRLAAVVQPVPQVLINVPVARRDGWEEEPGIQAAIAAARQRLGEGGRILVRPSGTEPLIRVMVEGDDEALVRELAESVAGAIRRALGRGTD
ncbi:phosphoglucosamine mutase [Thermaerobacter marianensis DSM 12885]|uniref:Phosphoglucosamine mutase n=1 Tax=Thermaerobacter marianensis (strain ATCC 700841 / DSM 12885 / JCM 10246 / 7p75a) TaxID=644966 RepID=E6SM33_THEM7|nr:phosphoglucosamine mutase [Thermaerobacter marianensis]ADU50363.1 phosphoglucosamine mutase [Thermaerobacter marianensis DSM 12885]